MLPWFSLARTYGWILRLLRYQGRIRGMGFLLRKVKRDHLITASGLQFFFNHRVAGCYDALVAWRRFGERETHGFLERVLSHSTVSLPVLFVDVGANIGEIALDMARHPKIARVLAFEPQSECVRALRATAAVNELAHKATARAVALCSAAGIVRFNVDPRSPSASGVLPRGSEGLEVEASTLDIETVDIDSPAILKIDVEGGELDVLQGGGEFVARCRPLIVFEFNAVSRGHFNLDQVRGVLGPSYEIWRLRGDGTLDCDLEHTWNCVAVHGGSIFATACRSLVVDDGARLTG